MFDIKVGSFGTSEYTKNKLLKELKKLGYDAMIDHAGIGRVGTTGPDGKRIYSDQQGIAPLIIFDKDDLLEEISTNRVNDEEQASSRRKYMDWYRSLT